ncbi:MAG: cell division protein FtsA [Candidatus Wallbacteria bacterium]|nr:cell division protein FtsA [Candidatus Wallbacteria bacterium]
MPHENFIVALDIGATKVCLLIGECSEDKIKIIGKANYQSLGIKKGIVVDLEKTIYSIEACIEKAEKMADVAIDSAFISIGGPHIQSLNNKGLVAVSGAIREISQDDMDRVIETAKTSFPMPPNRKCLHVLPREYTIDEQGGIRDPLGMAGTRLGVELHIITGLSTSIQNLLKCVHSAGVSEEELVFSAYASSFAVLNEDEKELGVVLIDIGGGTTGVSIFTGGSIIFSTVLPLGGEHVSNDIAIGMRTPLEEAEKLKVNRGFAIAEEVDPNEQIEISTPGGDDVNLVHRKKLCQIIQCRMEEIFSMAKTVIQESGCIRNLSSGAVLTGGGSLLAGNQLLAEKILGLPVRLGKPGKDITGMSSDINSPIYSTAIGLLKYGMIRRQESTKQHLTSGWLEFMMSKLKKILSP